jgi:hypothetical protein
VNIPAAPAYGIRRRTDNAMAKRNSRNGHTIIFKTYK